MDPAAPALRWSRRRWLTAGAAATLALPGCGRRVDGPLRLWAMGREGEVIGELLADFRAQHPGIEVRVEALPWSAAHEKLLTAFAGDATPDIAQMGNTWLPEMAALGALLPLDEGLRDAPEIDPADYFEGLWQTNRPDGRLLGVPWYVDTRLLFYRRDVLAEAGIVQPPVTWDSWVAALRKVKRRAGAGRYAVLLPVNEFEPLVAFALQSDEPLLRDGGRYGHFRGDGFRRVWRFFLSLYREGLAPTSAAHEIANVWHEFARGFFSFYISGPWQIGEFRRRLPVALQPHWGTMPLPGPAGPGASIAGGSSLAIFARSRRQREAWALLRWLSRPASQLKLHALTGNLPPRRSAWMDPALANDPHARAFAEQLERVRPVPPVPEWERIATEMRVVLEATLRGDLADEPALAELDRRTDRILEKRRWMLERRA